MYYLQLLFYDYVFKWNFRYQLSFNNVAIVSVKENRYMNKDGPINVMKNSDLKKKSKYF